MYLFEVGNLNFHFYIKNINKKLKEVKKRMSKKKEVIIWVGGKYTLKKGETIDSVMEAFNEEVFDLELNITKITDLKGNNLKETTIE
ncbi:hypothetical protein LCGC14_1038560 [marine sediment metagenome]|uniref:Uncharacterized protein n=1 Tax=marine sediment metagenome TaxID=412755 RepID=A0A0F9NE41_9ZZZZ